MKMASLNLGNSITDAVSVAGHRLLGGGFREVLAAGLTAISFAPVLVGTDVKRIKIMFGPILRP